MGTGEETTGTQEQGHEELLLKLRIRLMEYAVGHTLDELLQYTLDEVCAFTNSPVGFYHFVDPDQESLTLQAWSTRTLREFCTAEEHSRHYPVKEAGVWCDCLHARKPVIHNDVAALPHRKGLPTGHAVIIRELVAPVLRNELPVALLGVGNKPEPYTDDDVREVSFLADVAWTITEQKRTQVALQESEALLRLFQEHSPVYTYIKDEQLKIVDASRNFEQMLGRPLDQIIGRKTEELFPPEFAQKIIQDDRAVLAGGAAAEFEEEFGGRSYRSIKFPLKRGDRNYLAGHTMDITEYRTAARELSILRQQMLRQDKMASIGLLASGIAHEINNPVGFISSNLMTLGKYFDRLESYMETLEEELGEEGDHQEKLERITARKEALKITRIRQDLPQLIGESSEGTERVKMIVQELKLFSRSDENRALESTDLNLCIRSAVNIVTNEIKYVADLKLFLGDIPRICCNPQQISQVVMNLLVNAAQAMIGHGEITVRSWSDADRVYISVRDSGRGIPERELPRIFEPLFTTKEAGRGTGLGLSISLDIVRKHGGTIQVESSEGEGSLFTIQLPMRSAA